MRLAFSMTLTLIATLFSPVARAAEGPTVLRFECVLDGTAKFGARPEKAVQKKKKVFELYADAMVVDGWAFRKHVTDEKVGLFGDFALEEANQIRSFADANRLRTKEGIFIILNMQTAEIFYQRNFMAGRDEKTQQYEVLQGPCTQELAKPSTQLKDLKFY